MKRFIFMFMAVVAMLAVPVYAAEGDIPSAEDNIMLITEDDQQETIVISELPIPLPVEDVARPALTTPFDDYSVVEGYLLLIFLSLFVALIISIFKGVLSWV